MHLFFLTLALSRALDSLNHTDTPTYIGEVPYTPIKLKLIRDVSNGYQTHPLTSPNGQPYFQPHHNSDGDPTSFLIEPTDLEIKKLFPGGILVINDNDKFLNGPTSLPEERLNIPEFFSGNSKFPSLPSTAEDLSYLQRPSYTVTSDENQEEPKGSDETDFGIENGKLFFFKVPKNFKMSDIKMPSFSEDGKFLDLTSGSNSLKTSSNDANKTYPIETTTQRATTTTESIKGATLLDILHNLGEVNTDNDEFLGFLNDPLRQQRYLEDVNPASVYLDERQGKGLLVPEGYVHDPESTQVKNSAFPHIQNPDTFLPNPVDIHDPEHMQDKNPQHRLPQIENPEIFLPKPVGMQPTNNFGDDIEDPTSTSGFTNMVAPRPNFPMNPLQTNRFEDYNAPNNLPDGSVGIVNFLGTLSSNVPSNAMTGTFLGANGPGNQGVIVEANSFSDPNSPNFQVNSAPLNTPEPQNNFDGTALMNNQGNQDVTIVGAPRFSGPNGRKSIPVPLGDLAPPNEGNQNVMVGAASFAGSYGPDYQVNNGQQNILNPQNNFGSMPENEEGNQNVVIVGTPMFSGSDEANFPINNGQENSQQPQINYGSSMVPNNQANQNGAMVGVASFSGNNGQNFQVINEPLNMQEPQNNFAGSVSPDLQGNQNGVMVATSYLGSNRQNEPSNHFDSSMAFNDEQNQNRPMIFSSERGPNGAMVAAATFSGSNVPTDISSGSQNNFGSSITNNQQNGVMIGVGSFSEPNGQNIAVIMQPPNLPESQNNFGGPQNNPLNSNPRNQHGVMVEANSFSRSNEPNFPVDMNPPNLPGSQNNYVGSNHNQMNNNPQSQNGVIAAAASFSGTDVQNIAVNLKPPNLPELENDFGGSMSSNNNQQNQIGIMAGASSYSESNGQNFPENMGPPYLPEPQNSFGSSMPSNDNQQNQNGVMAGASSYSESNRQNFPVNMKPTDTPEAQNSFGNSFPSNDNQHNQNGVMVGATSYSEFNGAPSLPTNQLSGQNNSPMNSIQLTNPNNLLNNAMQQVSSSYSAFDENEPKRPGFTESGMVDSSGFAESNVDRGFTKYGRQKPSNYKTIRPIDVENNNRRSDVSAESNSFAWSNDPSYAHQLNKYPKHSRDDCRDLDGSVNNPGFNSPQYIKSGRLNQRNEYNYAPDYNGLRSVPGVQENVPYFPKTSASLPYNREENYAKSNNYEETIKPNLEAQSYATASNGPSEMNAGYSESGIQENMRPGVFRSPQGPQNLFPMSDSFSSFQESPDLKVPNIQTSSNYGAPNVPFKNSRERFSGGSDSQENERTNPMEEFDNSRRNIQPVFDAPIIPRQDTVESFSNSRSFQEDDYQPVVESFSGSSINRNGFAEPPIPPERNGESFPKSSFQENSKPNQEQDPDSEESSSGLENRHIQSTYQQSNLPDRYFENGKREEFSGPLNVVPDMTPPKISLVAPSDLDVPKKKKKSIPNPDSVERFSRSYNHAGLQQKLFHQDKKSPGSNKFQHSKDIEDSYKPIRYGIASGFSRGRSFQIGNFAEPIISKEGTKKTKVRRRIGTKNKQQNRQQKQNYKYSSKASPTDYQENSDRDDTNEEESNAAQVKEEVSKGADDFENGFHILDSQTNEDTNENGVKESSIVDTVEPTNKDDTNDEDTNVAEETEGTDVVEDDSYTIDSQTNEESPDNGDTDTPVDDTQEHSNTDEINEDESDSAPEETEGADEDESDSLDSQTNEDTTENGVIDTISTDTLELRKSRTLPMDTNDSESITDSSGDGPFEIDEANSDSDADSPDGETLESDSSNTDSRNADSIDGEPSNGDTFDSDQNYDTKSDNQYDKKAVASDSFGSDIVERDTVETNVNEDDEFDSNPQDTDVIENDPEE